MKSNNEGTVYISEVTEMDVDVDQLAVVHNAAEKRFEVQVGNWTAFAEYMPAGKNIVFTHTEVPTALEGKGIAKKLAKVALDYAKDNELKIQALCPFIASYIREHPEYQPITWGYSSGKQ